jgi:acyl-CoA synthetase (AMP-forming)/AMP-acid ligase II
VALQHIIRTISDALAGQPNRKALTFVGRNGVAETVTAGELLRSVRQCVTLLQARGVGQDDVVVIALGAQIDIVSAFLASVAVGALPSVFPGDAPRLNPMAYARRLEAALNRLNPVAVVVDRPWPYAISDRFSSSLIELRLDECERSGDVPLEDSVRAASNDRAFVQLSSGSTGNQKAVVISHDSIRNLVAARNMAFGITEDDVVVGWAPLYHDLGIVGSVLGPLLSGVHSVLIDTSHWVEHPSSLMRAVNNFSGTVCTMPNFGFGYCSSRVHENEMAGIDLDGWRVLCSAAEPVRAESLDRFVSYFSRWGFRREAVATAYGLAENTLTVTMTQLSKWPRVDSFDGRSARVSGVATACPSGTDGAVSVVSCGLPLSNVVVETRSSDGKVLSDRQIGEVFIRSSSLFTEYYRDSALTERVKRDGGLYTGDFGYLSGGELFLCGRKADVIVVAGLNIYAEEIERLVGTNVAVRPGRAVAFGLSDRKRDSERVVVLCEVRETVDDAAAAIASIRSQIHAEFDIGSFVQVVPTGWIEKTSSGKLARWRNREKYLGEYVGVSELNINEQVADQV